MTNLHAHPVLAGLLGFIPGVGAMYNGQFVKALAHVLIFAVFVSLSDKSFIFGMLVAAWTFYQVFDAAQTAKARRDGLPLPNPFRTQRSGRAAGGDARGPALRSGFSPTAAPGGNAAANPAPVKPGQNPAAGGPFQPPPGTSYAAPPPPPGRLSPDRESVLPPLIRLAITVVLCRAPLSGRLSEARLPGSIPYPPAPEPQGHRHPLGAIVLIGIGLLLLLHTLGVFEEEWIGRAWPLIIIGVGAWLLYRRTPRSAAGRRLMNTWLLIRRLRGPAFLIMFGITALLNQWDVLSFGRSWPLYLILAGVLGLAERAALAAAPPPTYCPLPRPPARIPSCRPIPARTQSPRG